MLTCEIQNSPSRVGNSQRGCGITREKRDDNPIMNGLKLPLTYASFQTAVSLLLNAIWM